MIERPSLLTPCLSRDAVWAQESEDLDGVLGWGICSLLLFHSLASLDRRIHKGQKGLVLRGCPKFSGLSKYPPSLERFSSTPLCWFSTPSPPRATLWLQYVPASNMYRRCSLLQLCMEAAETQQLLVHSPVRAGHIWLRSLGANPWMPALEFLLESRADRCMWTSYNAFVSK